MTKPGTIEYFNEELNRFREAMCSCDNSIEYIDRLFKGLAYVAIHTKADHLSGWNMICEEWPRRRVWMELQNCGLLTKSA